MEKSLNEMSLHELKSYRAAVACFGTIRELREVMEKIRELERDKDRSLEIEKIDNV